jgi:hypothetical protein
MGVGNGTSAGVGLFVLARVGEAVVIMLLMRNRGRVMVWVQEVHIYVKMGGKGLIFTF